MGWEHHFGNGWAGASTGAVQGDKHWRGMAGVQVCAKRRKGKLTGKEILLCGVGNCNVRAENSKKLHGSDGSITGRNTKRS